MRIKFFILLIFLLGVAISVSAESSSNTISTDLENDGIQEKIVFNKQQNPALKIFRGKKLLWQGISSRWNPWKMLISDVDGDGKKEIILGIYKSTKFFPKPHNCLFIYQWNNQKLLPKWLGSSLGRTFTDFIFGDLDNSPGDELVSLEKTLDGKFGLAVYHWDSFGFTFDGKFGNWSTASLLIVEKQLISVEADGEELQITKDRLLKPGG
jgi:hypothetical protein